MILDLELEVNLSFDRVPFEEPREGVHAGIGDLIVYFVRGGHGSFFGQTHTVVFETLRVGEHGMEGGDAATLVFGGDCHGSILSQVEVVVKLSFDSYSVS